MDYKKLNKEFNEKNLIKIVAKYFLETDEQKFERIKDKLLDMNTYEEGDFSLKFIKKYLDHFEAQYLDIYYSKKYPELVEYIKKESKKVVYYCTFCEFIYNSYDTFIGKIGQDYCEEFCQECINDYADKYDIDINADYIDESDSCDSFCECQRGW